MRCGRECVHLPHGRAADAWTRHRRPLRAQLQGRALDTAPGLGIQVPLEPLGCRPACRVNGALLPAGLHRRELRHGEVPGGERGRRGSAGQRGLDAPPRRSLLWPPQHRRVSPGGQQRQRGARAPGWPWWRPAEQAGATPASTQRKESGGQTWWSHGGPPQVAFSLTGGGCIKIRQCLDRSGGSWGGSVEGGAKEGGRAGRTF